MIEQNKNGIIIIVLLSTFFGLVAGIVGSMTIKSYLGTSSAFWGELNFINNNLERPNLVINGAKKVVVAQDEKINETISQINPSLVGIYKKKATSTKKNGIDLNSFYKSSEQIGSALIVTSDGWLISDALSQINFSEKNKNINLKKYIVIDSNKNIYKINDAVVDTKTGYTFFHIIAKDLPVVNIAKHNDLKIGETVLGLNSKNEAFLSSIFSLKDMDDYLSLSSDFYFDKISLVNNPNKDFYSSFVFDVSGRLILLLSREGNLIPARVFNSSIETLFVDNKISRPSMGIEYIDLSYLIYNGGDEKNIQRKGALVLKNNRVATKEKLENILQVNDLIESINGIVLDRNNNLSKIIMDYSVGDEIDVGILRNSEELNFKLELEKLK